MKIVLASNNEHKLRELRAILSDLGMDVVPMRELDIHIEPDENGAVGSLRVICSSAGAGVDLGLKCHIQAEVLKKLLSRCQVCAEASLHAFKAGRCAGDE